MDRANKKSGRDIYWPSCKKTDPSSYTCRLQAIRANGMKSILEREEDWKISLAARGKEIWQVIAPSLEGWDRKIDFWKIGSEGIIF